MKIWLEMSRDIEHGGEDWGFKKCIWAPTYKKGTNKSKTWPFWDNVCKVNAEDYIIHLRGRGHDAKFIGYSIAKTDGQVTKEHPPLAGEWDYCESFYRAYLKDFASFDNPINLYQLFDDKSLELKKYYEEKEKPRNIFYTIQSERLQCLNGGYLSEIDDNLLSIILNYADGKDAESAFVGVSVSTSVVIKEIRARVGQERFAKNIKNNYNNRCCFPECNISDKEFLIASHIARWADNIEKRGHTSNGLCFCPIHDKAFELGYFSLDDDFRICVEHPKDHSQVFKEYISRFTGKSISKGIVEPDREALEEHRKRCEIK